MTLPKTLLSGVSALGLMLTAAACSEGGQSTTVAEYVTPAGEAEQFAEAGDLDTETMETDDELEMRADTAFAQPESNVELGQTSMADAATAAQSVYLDEDGEPVMDEAAPREAFQLADGQLEASRLIGASLMNGSGEEIAEVADVWLGDNRGEVTLLVRNGGLLGFGGDLYQLSFSDAQIVPALADEGDLIVRTASADLDALPGFEQQGLNDYRLASEVLGAIAPMSFSGESARINELILSEDGELRYAVISPGIVSREPLVVEGRAVTVSQGDSDGEVVLDLTEEDLAAAMVYPAD